MRAAYLNRVAGPEGLLVGDLPRPAPAEGQVVVRVRAAAVTPTEFKWFPTFRARNGEPRPFPIVPGHEFCGVIEDLGDAVSGFSRGESVYGMNDWFSNGAQAEYCVAPANALSPRPESLRETEAATVPISALTAWQGLFDRCQLKAGESVLVHGGAGGVGLFAVQLAHWRGARVFATASKRNADFVSSLGADEVINYKTTPFEQRARDIDVVFDTVGGETLTRSWSVLRPEGRLVTVASPNETTPAHRVRDAFFIVEPNQAQLSEISRLLDSRILHASVAEVFPLGAVRAAYVRAQQGGMLGKIAIKVDGET